MRMFDEEQNIVRRLELLALDEPFLQFERGTVIHSAEILIEEHGRLSSQTFIVHSGWFQAQLTGRLFDRKARRRLESTKFIGDFRPMPQASFNPPWFVRKDLDGLLTCGGYGPACLAIVESAIIPESSFGRRTTCPMDFCSCASSSAGVSRSSFCSS